MDNIPAAKNKFLMLIVIIDSFTSEKVMQTNPRLSIILAQPAGSFCSLLLKNILNPCAAGNEPSAERLRTHVFTVRIREYIYGDFLALTLARPYFA